MWFNTVSCTWHPSGSGASQDHVIAAWAAVQALHILFRRIAVATLVFPTLSRKRACILVSQHVRGQALEAPVAVNAREPLWESSASMQPWMVLGCGLDQLLRGWRPSGGGDGGGTSIASSTISSGSGWCEAPPDAQPYIDLYGGEQYMLAWRDGLAHVALKQGAGTKAVLRALWQAAWLQRDGEVGGEQLVPQQGGETGYPSSQPAGAPLSPMGERASAHRECDEGQQLRILQRSMAARDSGFTGIEAEARAIGWEVDKVAIKGGSVRVAVDTAAQPVRI